MKEKVGLFWRSASPSGQKGMWKDRPAPSRLGEGSFPDGGKRRDKKAAGGDDRLVGALQGLPSFVLAGVSGGMDSVSLLHALASAGKEVVVLHLDHAWRQDSSEDRRFVEELALRYGFLCFWERLNFPGKLSEGEARRARWDFFLRASRRFGCRDLVLAHHADDQAETVLLRLLRGTGTGAVGMRSPARFGQLLVHRPWLGFWREEIAAYAHRHGLAWREDATNEDLRYARNFVRRRLFPWLERSLGGSARRSLWRFAELHGAVVDWLDSLVEAHLSLPTLGVVMLRGLPLALQRHLVYRWLQSQGVSDVGFEEVEAVRRLAEAPRPHRCNLARGWYARRKSGRIWVEKT
jgi:tRNA(Ile)-lysidine synthase